MQHPQQHHQQQCTRCFRCSHSSDARCCSLWFVAVPVLVQATAIFPDAGAVDDRDGGCCCCRCLSPSPSSSCCCRRTSSIRRPRGVAGASWRLLLEVQAEEKRPSIASVGLSAAAVSCRLHRPAVDSSWCGCLCAWTARRAAVTATTACLPARLPACLILLLLVRSVDRDHKKTVRRSTGDKRQTDVVVVFVSFLSILTKRNAIK